MMTLVSLPLTDPSLLSFFSNSSFMPTLNLSLPWDSYLIMVLLNSQIDESTCLCNETPTTQHQVSNTPLMLSPPASAASTPYTAASASPLPQSMCVCWSPNGPTLWRLLSKHDITSKFGSKPTQKPFSVTASTELNFDLCHTLFVTQSRTSIPCIFVCLHLHSILRLYISIPPPTQYLLKFPDIQDKKFLNSLCLLTFLCPWWQTSGSTLGRCTRR